MQNKLYLLLAVLFVFVICSICAEPRSRQRDSAFDFKKKPISNDKEDNYENEKVENDDQYAEVDDSRPLSPSYAHNRFSTVNSGSENNQRTRSRWSASPLPSTPPSSYDELLNGDDWSRPAHRNPYSTALPSISYDNNAMLNNGPTCNSLIDPQYAIFSDTCGAVPQARYSLPNLFGHRERWQVAQILSTLMSSSTDPACTRSLRLLLCPVLFPPCQTRYESPPVLPCQSYCRTIKARCAIPALDLLPCELLPYSSDICPTNQAYGSFIPPGAFPSVSQPLMMPNAYPSGNYPPGNYLPGNYPSGNYLPGNYPPGNYPPGNYPSGNYPSGNYPTAGSFPSLQSLLSSQSLQSAFASSPLSFGPSPLPAAPAPLPAAPSPLPSASQHSAQSLTPFNLYNGAPHATDNFASMLNDFPARPYTNDYREASLYPPLTRSSTETRSTSETRPGYETRIPTVTRPTPDGRNSAATRPSLVKA